MFVAVKRHESSIRTTITELIRVDQEREIARETARRRELDDVVQARLVAEAAAREQERMRDEAEAALREQRARDAREESARLHALHDESVRVLRERLARDMADIEALQAGARARESTWRARAQAFSVAAFVGVAATIGAIGFAFVARDPAGSVARWRSSEGVALDLRGQLDTERHSASAQSSRIASLQRTIDELNSRPVITPVVATSGPKPIRPPGTIPVPTGQSGHKGPDCTGSYDPLCGVR